MYVCRFISYCVLFFFIFFTACENIFVCWCCVGSEKFRVVFVKLPQFPDVDRRGTGTGHYLLYCYNPTTSTVFAQFAGISTVRVMGNKHVERTVYLGKYHLNKGNRRLRPPGGGLPTPSLPAVSQADSGRKIICARTAQLAQALGFSGAEIRGCELLRLPRYGGCSHPDGSGVLLPLLSNKLL